MKFEKLSCQILTWVIIALILCVSAANANDYTVRENDSPSLGKSAQSSYLKTNGNMNVELVGHIGGEVEYCSKVYVDGDYAYVGDNNTLLILDISDSSRPLLMSNFVLNDRVMDIYTTGGLAYIANSRNGLQIMDVRNPSKPTLKGSFDTSGTAVALCVSDGIAYVADSSKGLQIIDVSNPTTPILIVNYNTLKSVVRVYVKGHIAYIGDGSKGLVILDISNPAHPAHLGSFHPYYGLTGLYVSGDYAYMLDYKTYMPHKHTADEKLLGGQLIIVDVSNPSAPRAVGHYGGYDTFIEVSNEIYVEDGLAYIIEDMGWLSIFDVSDPERPFRRSFYRLFKEWGFGRYSGVFAEGEMVYVAAGKFLILDAHNPDEPVLKGFYGSLMDTNRVYVKNGLAYVADGIYGLHIYDVSEPTSPTLLGFYDTQTYIVDFCSSGDVICATESFEYTDRNIELIDVSNPYKPTKIKSYMISVCFGGCSPLFLNGIFTDNGFIYVTGDGVILMILDLSNPETPLIKSYWGASIMPYEHAKDVFVKDGLAFVTLHSDYSDRGLYILDVTDPENIGRKGMCDTPGEAKGIYICGDAAYVADYKSGLAIIDASNPEEPALKGMYDTQGWAVAVHTSEGMAYIADWTGGLQIVDVSDPATPLLMGYCATSGTTQGVYVDGDLIYVADGRGGLKILRYTGPVSRKKIKNHILGISPLKLKEIPRADTNKDSVIDVSDIVKVIKDFSPR